MRPVRGWLAVMRYVLTPCFSRWGNGAKVCVYCWSGVTQAANAYERALRPSVIFRKVTGGFRAEWGARVYAAAVSIIVIGRLHGLTTFGALRAALAGEAVMQTA